MQHTAWQRTGGDVPQAQGAVPGAGQAELAVGGDHHVLRNRDQGCARQQISRLATCMPPGCAAVAAGQPRACNSACPMQPQPRQRRCTGSHMRMDVVGAARWPRRARLQTPAARQQHRSMPDKHQTRLDVVGVAAQGALGEAQGAILVVGQLPHHHGLVAAAGGRGGWRAGEVRLGRGAQRGGR